MFVQPNAAVWKEMCNFIRATTTNNNEYNNKIVVKTFAQVFFF